MSSFLVIKKANSYAKFSAFLVGAVLLSTAVYFAYSIAKADAAAPLVITGDKNNPTKIGLESYAFANAVNLGNVTPVITGGTITYTFSDDLVFDGNQPSGTAVTFKLLGRVKIIAPSIKFQNGAIIDGSGEDGKQGSAVRLKDGGSDITLKALGGAGGNGGSGGGSGGAGGLDKNFALTASLGGAGGIGTDGTQGGTADPAKAADKNRVPVKAAAGFGIGATQSASGGGALGGTTLNNALRNTISQNQKSGIAPKDGLTTTKTNLITAKRNSVPAGARYKNLSSNDDSDIPDFIVQKLGNGGDGAGAELKVGNGGSGGAGAYIDRLPGVEGNTDDAAGGGGGGGGGHAISFEVNGGSFDLAAGCSIKVNGGDGGALSGGAKWAEEYLLLKTGWISSGTDPLKAPVTGVGIVLRNTSNANSWNIDPGEWDHWAVGGTGGAGGAGSVVVKLTNPAPSSKILVGGTIEANGGSAPFMTVAGSNDTQTNITPFGNGGGAGYVELKGPASAFGGLDQTHIKTNPGRAGFDQYFGNTNGGVAGTSVSKSGGANTLKLNTSSFSDGNEPGKNYVSPGQTTTYINNNGLNGFLSSPANKINVELAISTSSNTYDFKQTDFSSIYKNASVTLTDTKKPQILLAGTDNLTTFNALTLTIPSALQNNEIITATATYKEVTPSGTFVKDLGSITDLTQVVRRSIFGNIYSAAIGSKSDLSGISDFTDSVAIFGADKPTNINIAPDRLIQNYGSPLKEDSSAEWGNAEMTRRINRLKQFATPVTQANIDTVLNTLKYGNVNAVYYYKGSTPLEIGKTAPVTISGRGTIIVDGDLWISSNLKYSAPGDSDSIGFIVKGNVQINPTNSTMIGAYYVLKDVDWSKAASAISEAGNGFKGSLVYFGKANFGKGIKSFEYDSRITTNPPPGFDALYLPEWQQ